MSEPKNDVIDPDPFLIAGLCLQGSAIILQLVQIAQQSQSSQTSVGAINQRSTVLEQVENHLEAFDKAIAKAEKFVRRNSDSPEKEMYNVSFRVSLGILNLSGTASQEYHNNVADITTNLANFTRWIGHIIGNDPEMAAELGHEIVKITTNSADRLNDLMAKGGSIEAILAEAKLVRDALKRAISHRLDDRSN